MTILGVARIGETLVISKDDEFELQDVKRPNRFIRLDRRDVATLIQFLASDPGRQIAKLGGRDVTEQKVPSRN